MLNNSEAMKNIVLTNLLSDIDETLYNNKVRITQIINLIVRNPI